MKKKYVRGTMGMAVVLWLLPIYAMHGQTKMSEASTIEAMRKSYPGELIFVTAADAKGGREVEVLCNRFNSGVLSVKRDTRLRDLISESKEFSVSTPMEGQEEAVIYCLSHANGKMDKFKETGLETLAPEKVKAPLIKGTISSHEFQVEDQVDMGDSTVFKAKHAATHIYQSEAGRLCLSGVDGEGKFIVKGFAGDANHPARADLIVSADKNGKPNAMPVGMCLLVSENPCMLGAFIGKTRYSYGLIKARGEFVYAVPGEDYTNEVLYCGTHSGKDVDKFNVLSMKTVPAKKVGVPLLAGCLVNFECRVAGEIDRDYWTIFVGEVVSSSISDNNARRLFMAPRGKGGPRYNFIGLPRTVNKTGEF